MVAAVFGNQAQWDFGHLKLAVAGLLLCFVAAGCSEPRAAAVDAVLAKATLIEVLDHWQKGGSIDELRQRVPEVVAQEMLWSGGRKLREYKLIDEGRAEDANWFCEVELVLEQVNGTEPDRKQLTYVIGTDPVLTVFRAML